MCNILLKDPVSNSLWQTSIDGVGALITTPQGFTVAHFQPPLLTGDGALWQIQVDGVGDITLGLGAPRLLPAIDYIVMSDPTGKPYKVFVTGGVLATQALTTRPPDAIPHQIDTSMSNFPEGYNGVMCPSCHNASITVTADFGCWCCVCNTFVPPEDTTILVALDE